MKERSLHLSACGLSYAEQAQGLVMQLENYNAARREEIETSIRIEPGDPSLSADLETPHFKQYNTRTQNMVTSLKRIETNPIVLGAKSK
jgi:hypothetical protein